MTFTDLLAAASALGVLLTAIIGYVRLRQMTPLEKSQKIKSDVDAQSGIIHDLENAIQRSKDDAKRCDDENKTLAAKYEELAKQRDEENKALAAENKAAVLLLRAELTACKEEFEASKTQWAATELHLRRLMDKSS